MTAALRLVASPEPARHTLLSGHPASAHQSAIFDAIADPRSGSKMVIAVAGSGKTTTFKNALRHVPPGTHVQGVAFGKDAAAALKGALAAIIAVDGPERYRNVRMGTIHSVCYAAILRSLGLRAKPNKNKLREILKARLTPDDHDVYASFVASLVSKAKGDGVGVLVPDTEDRWYDLVEHYGLYLDSEDATVERGIEIARKVLAYSTSDKVTKERRSIDFDDMPYLVLLWRLRLWRNDLVLLDEEQDTNATGRAIVRLLLKPGGRLFAAGDPFQSIYGFRGASVDATKLIRREFRATDLPLTISWRCSRAVVTEARRWVDHIESAPGAPEGSVEWLPEEDGLKEITATDAVLCRQTAPLVTLAYKLIAAGRGCRVLGKEIGEGLVALVRAQRAKGVDRLVVKLEAWRDREAASFMAKGDETAAEAVVDRVECVMVVVRALPETERTVPELERRILALFEDRLGAELLTLATCHKAKGLEWETVGILRPDLMPSRAARQEWEHQQEQNLQYVAATRAKLRLIYLEREV